LAESGEGRGPLGDPIGPSGSSVRPTCREWPGLGYYDGSPSGPRPSPLSLARVVGDRGVGDVEAAADPDPVVLGDLVGAASDGGDDEPARVRAEPSRVPAERTAARHLRQALDREPDVLALDGLAHELVVDPAPAVAHHLVAGLDDRPRRLRVPFERHRDGEEA